MSEDRRHEAAQEPPHRVGEGVPSIAPARIWKAFGYSLQGLASAWRTEGAFRQEVLAAIVLVPVALIVPVSPVEHVLLAASVLFVMVVELLNSSIEATIDRISTERHALSGKAKDQGSAAVLIAIVMAFLTWGYVLGPAALAALL
jgi:diacylglycerol kinase (ATP)